MTMGDVRNFLRLQSRLWSGFFLVMMMLVVPVVPAMGQERTETSDESGLLTGEGSITQILPNRNSLYSDNDEGNFDQETRRESSERERRSRVIRDNVDGADTSNSVAEEIRARAIAAAAPRATDEFEIYISKAIGRNIRRFGVDILVPGSGDFTLPFNAPVPEDYRLNAGDEILIRLVGPVPTGIDLSAQIQAEGLRLRVNPEGLVFIPRIGAISVTNIAYGELQAYLADKISRYYRELTISVTLQKLGGITVYVTGFANTPGSYTMSGLSTLVNAVLAAGGPSPGGSLRSIHLRRKGQIVTELDMYDLLLKGDKSDDAILQNGDVIHIAPIGSQIAVIGSVNREAIFETRPGDTLDTLEDALHYAGGMNTVADDSRVLVYNPLDQQSGGWLEVPTQALADRKIRRGEILRAISIVDLQRPTFVQPVLVAISGEVNKPGNYYLKPGATLGTLLDKAGGLTAQAYPFASIFTREKTLRNQQASFARALDDLRRRLTAAPLVSVSSRGLNPARTILLNSLVSQIESRSPEGRLVLGLSTSNSELPRDFILENNDRLVIPPRPVTVGIFGAVSNPVTVEYQPGMKIGDYIRRAGGTHKYADKSEIFVIHANGLTEMSSGGLFGKGIVKRDALPGDLIFVPIDGTRGEFWNRIRDILQLVSTAAISAAAIDGLTR